MRRVKQGVPRDLPFSRQICRLRKRVRKHFESDYPLPNFIILSDFLDEDWLHEALAGCRNAELATFCGYSPTGDPDDVRNEFREPDEEGYYITIHERPVQPVPQLSRLHESMIAPDAVRVVSELTGIELSLEGHKSVLSCWGPWSFIEGHTDAGDPAQPTRVVISLSLTERWEPGYGGAAKFHWGDSGESVAIQPRLNSAVIFAPFAGSFHWVEQVSDHAPPRLRFTLTTAYV